MEFEETEFLNLKGLLCTPCAPKPELTSTSNAFHALTDEEDEEAVVAALCEMTSSIKVGPKPTQSQQAAAKRSPLTPKLVKKIAAAVNRGDIALPELDLKDDDEYEAA